MRNFRFGALVAISAAALLGFSLPAIAQDGVTVQFTGGYTTTWGNSGGDYGAGIYSANINGAPSSSGIICDDFNDEITSGETWNASAYQVSSLVSSTNPTLGDTLFGKTIGVTGYADVATLVSMMFSGASSYGSITGITQAELSSAIWYLTTPGGITGLDAKALALVGAVQLAFNNNLTGATDYLASLTNLWILTPSPLTGVGSGEPQEMFTMALAVPEGGAAILYLLLAALACGGAIFFGRRKQFVAQKLVRATYQ
jgi:hypothetical protein